MVPRFGTHARTTAFNDHPLRGKGNHLAMCDEKLATTRNERREDPRRTDAILCDEATLPINNKPHDVPHALARRRLHGETVEFIIAEKHTEA